MSRRTQYADDRDDLPFMVHSELDDLDLSPYEFRAYAHIVRRVNGSNRVYNESISNGAKHCRMSVSTYRNALVTLVELGLLTRTERVGRPAVFRVTPKRDWTATPARSGTGQAAEPLPEVTEAPGSTPTKTDRGDLSEVIGDPYQIRQGTPTKSDRQRESLEESPSKRVLRRDKGSRPGPEKNSTKFDPLSVELPEQVTPEVWSEFVAHRREIRKALTPTATQRLLRNLESFGPAADQALRNSVANGWTGVFAPKDEKPELSRAGNRADARAAQSATDLLTAIRSRKSAG